jgi:hypothetical protein
MTTENDTIPEEFSKIIKDFVGDLKITFPEYVTFINKWWYDIESFHYIEDEEERMKMYINSQTKSIQLLFDFCKIKFPPRIFDILYQNEEMFKETSEIDTEFLPKIHFKNLWQCDISEKTRVTIWKYLQLIMFTIIGTLDKKEAFGDTAKLFESINQDEFKNKLEETLTHMQGLFDKSSDDDNETKFENLGDGINIPNAQELHQHITGMLDGKLGQLAREIAEETAADLNDNFEDATDMKDIFQKIVKNPTKMMDLVKSVSEKLDTRLKTGELKESEIIAEATNIMNQMKDMPGMNNIQSMLSSMGLGNLGNLGGKINTGGMETQLNNKMKIAKMKERIRAKAELNAKNKNEKLMMSQTEQVQETPSVSEEEILKLFSSIEKTPRGTSNNNNNKKNKKK